MKDILSKHILNFYPHPFPLPPTPSPPSPCIFPAPLTDETDSEGSVDLDELEKEPEPEPEPELAPAEWKAKGNEHYKIKEYIKAIECYTKAIDGAPEDPMFLNNRASARVMLLDFKGALEDSTKAMGLLPNTVKYMEKVSG